jgi:succinoglycan biosynthesis transport protein ExoP
LVLAIVYLLFAPSIYTAKAQLLIDLRLPQFLHGSSNESSLGLDSSQLESHIVLLQSERVATSVINKLGLLQDPEFQDKPGLLGGIFGASGPDEKLQTAIERFKKDLSVRRIGISYAVEVAFSSGDPAKAAKIANATTEAYLQSLIDFRAEAARVAMQTNAYTVSNAHLVSKALAPAHRSSPKILLVIAIALAAGALVGGCIAFLRDVAGRRTVSPQPATT